MGGSLSGSSHRARCETRRGDSARFFFDFFFRLQPLGSLAPVGAPTLGVFELGGAQFVTRAAQRLEGQCVTEFGSQAPNVDVDGARAAFVAVAPNARQEVLSR